MKKFLDEGGAICKALLSLLIGKTQPLAYKCLCLHYVRSVRVNSSMAGFCWLRRSDFTLLLPVYAIQAAVYTDTTIAGSRKKRLKLKSVAVDFPTLCLVSLCKFIDIIR